MLKRIGLLLVCLSAFVSASHAAFWEEDTVLVRYRLSVAAGVSTAAVVIDLSSNTTTWRHKETGEVDLDVVKIEVDKAAASTATVKLGVVNFVNESTGSVTWVYSKERELNVSNTDPRDYFDFRPNSYRLRVDPAAIPNTNGSTPYAFSNDTTTGSTTYQTDVNLPSPSTGNVAPGTGDVVLSVSNGTGAIVVNVEILYHTQRR